MNKKQETKQKLKKALKTNWKKYSKRKNQTKNEMNMRNKKRQETFFFLRETKVSKRKWKTNIYKKKRKKWKERKKP